MFYGEEKTGEGGMQISLSYSLEVIQYSSEVFGSGLSI